MDRRSAKTPRWLPPASTVPFNPNVALFGHYDGVFGRDNYVNNSVSGGLALSF